MCYIKKEQNSGKFGKGADNMINVFTTCVIKLKSPKNQLVIYFKWIITEIYLFLRSFSKHSVIFTFNV